MMTYSHPRTRRWPARSIALAAIGVSLFLDLGVLFVVPILFLLIVPFEKIRSALPANTPAYSADQRRAALAIRHRHLARREPVT